MNKGNQKRKYSEIQKEQLGDDWKTVCIRYFEPKSQKEAESFVSRVGKIESCRQERNGNWKVVHETNYSAKKALKFLDGKTVEKTRIQVMKYIFIDSNSTSKFKRGVGQNLTSEKKLPRLFTASKTGYLDQKRLFR